MYDSNKTQKSKTIQDKQSAQDYRHLQGNRKLNFFQDNKNNKAHVRSFQ